MNSMQALDPSSGKAISGLACDSGASNAGLTEAPPSGSGGIPIPIRRGIWLCFGGETAYDVATYFIATVLLAAAALKIQQLAQGDGPEMARQPGLFAVAVVGESAFGLWLLLGVAPTWSRRAATILFFAFAVVASLHYVNGDSACGCFGRLRTPPIAALTLDVIALLCLLLIRRHSTPVLASPRIFSAFVIVLGALVVSAFSARREIAQDTVIVFSAESELGKPFMLLEYVTPEDRQAIAGGQHAVVLFDPRCDECRSKLHGLAQGPQCWAIDISGTAGELARREFRSPIPEIHLRRGIKCVSPVPIYLVLRDGKVESST